MKLLHSLQGLTDKGKPAITPEEITIFSSLSAEFCAILRRSGLMVFGPNEKSVELPLLKIMEGRDIYTGTFGDIPITVSIKGVTGILVLDHTPKHLIAIDV